MTSCQQYGYSIGLQASKQALESSIVAWLKEGSNNFNPGCADTSIADFETDLSNDERTISNDDSVGFRETAMGQPWWLAMPECGNCAFMQEMCAGVDPLQTRTLHAEPLQEQPRVLCDSNRAPALPSTSIKLGVQLSRSNAATSVRWTVDAKKMRSTDRVVVSSLFMLLLSGQPMPFRMMLVPAVACRRRGGHCFKKARGVGRVQLKCEASDIPEDINTKIRFALSVGSEPLRGPHEHDLRHAMLCGLPRDEADWNFVEAEDIASHTFAVCLTVLNTEIP